MFIKVQFESVFKLWFCNRLAVVKLCMIWDTEKT